MKTKNKLMTVEEVNSLVKAKNKLILAANEDILRKIEKGNWIGGTIPYFIDVKGGCLDKQLVFVSDLTDVITDFKIKDYSQSDLKTITSDRFADGFTWLLIPGFSAIHQQFSIDVYTYPQLYDNPMVGWITGIDLAELGKITPKVINGTNGLFFENSAIAFHAGIKASKYAKVDIINLFEQGDGDLLTFKEDGFSCKECFVNGEVTNLSDYLVNNSIDTRLPIVADYSGAIINISIQNVDKEQHQVLFYAPVRKNIEYRIAKPIGDYVKTFSSLIPEDTTNVVASCNCILNYLYSELEGKKTGNFTGPITFGEIAYVLVNQTLVYLSIEDK